MVIYGILENDRPGAGRFWRVGPLELRIATASVRTGFAMTGFLQGVRWLVGGGAYGCHPTDSLVVGTAGRCRHRPLRMRCRKCGEMGDRKGRPYGKRLPLSGEPLGEADCHDQFANWSRNDRALQEVRCAGRCGERTERCRWQKQRSERVAAVKISSVRRKAAQKFWAPQQDHRPLRRGY